MVKTLSEMVLESVGKSSRAGLGEKLTSQDSFASPAQGTLKISIYLEEDITDPERELPDYTKSVYKGGPSVITVKIDANQAKVMSFVEKVLTVFKSAYPHQGEGGEDFERKLNPIPGTNDRAYYFKMGSMYKCIELGDDFKYSDVVAIKTVVSDAGGDIDDFDFSDLEQ